MEDGSKLPNSTWCSVIFLVAFLSLSSQKRVSQSSEVQVARLRLSRLAPGSQAIYTRRMHDTPHVPGFDVHWHNSLPSTNTHLREWVARDAQLPEGTVVAARCQTAGRGRYDRSWVAQPGRDLAFSLLLRPATPPAWIPSLTMVAALAVAEALDGLGLSPRLRWPNDVLTGRGKICGILAEHVPQEGGAVAAVIGVGVNVNMTEEEAAKIERPATSVLIDTRKRRSVEEVLNAVLTPLPDHFESWQRKGFGGIRKEWERRAMGVGREVTVRNRGQEHTGILLGFGEYGELLLQDNAGEVRTVLLGDVLF